MTKKIDPDKIRTDGGTQMRAEMDQDAIAEMAELYRRSEDSFPPIDVFDDGEDLWLADGFHRHGAAVEALLGEIECTVHKGTLREAILFAAGANGKHGVRRSNRDKRKAVLTLLEDEEWGKMSDRWVAEKVGVTHPFVAAIRQEAQLVTVTSCEGRVGKDGKTRAPRTVNPARGQREDDPEDRVLDGEEVQLDEEPAEDEIFGNAAYQAGPATAVKVDKYQLGVQAGKVMRGIKQGNDGTQEYQNCLRSISETIQNLEKWEKA